MLLKLPEDGLGGGKILFVLSLTRSAMPLKHRRPLLEIPIN